MNQLIKMNFVKNIVVVILSTLSFPFIKTLLSQIKYEQTNDFLLILSMLLVIVCFANFTFTYEKSNLKTTVGMIFSHFTTGWFMLLTALLLECILAVVMIIYPPFNIIVSSLTIMLYVGVVLYDFWDLLRAQ